MWFYNGLCPMGGFLGECALAAAREPQPTLRPWGASDAFAAGAAALDRQGRLAVGRRPHDALRAEGVAANGLITE